MAIIDWVILIVVILSVMSAAKAELIAGFLSLTGCVVGLVGMGWGSRK